jgi:glycosyltransferase involved in cell wall biosynthesis
MTTLKVVYDVTHVASRLGAASPTGIERVDATFARHFAERAARREQERSPGQAVGIHYGLRRPHLWSAGAIRALLAESERAWSAPDNADQVFKQLSDWLLSNVTGRSLPHARFSYSRRLRLGGRLSRLKWLVARSRGAELPQSVIYLNISQYGMKNSIFFRWLDGRPDVKPVFFIHDLLPLDCPEFFRKGYRVPFERVVATMARYAKAAIVSNAIVGARIAAEMRARGRGDLPLFSRPLPPPTAVETGTRRRPQGAAPTSSAPYFVAIGTIEPRKNHLLLLHVWRDLAKRDGEIPRLVLIGPRGWDNEQVIDLLERSPLLRPYVAEVSGLTTGGLRELIGGARAILSPSFEEGYGLPIVEALVEGTPVVASDIPVFREISQGRALFLDPTDGPGWRRAVSELAAPASALREHLARTARGFVAPTWSDYFDELETFLGSL